MKRCLSVLLCVAMLLCLLMALMLLTSCGGPNVVGEWKLTDVEGMENLWTKASTCCC